MNLTVIKQWFSLLFRGEVEMVHLSEEWIKKNLMGLYREDAIYIKEALCAPALEMIQVVARVPQPSYAPIEHLSTEQYNRVMSQTIGILGFASPERYPLKMEVLQANRETGYYRGQNLRFKRLVRPNEPFVVTMGLVSLREVKGIWQLKASLTDGPFVGELDTVLILTENVAIASEGLEEACYTLWQEIVHRLRSMVLTFATRRLKKAAFL